MCLESFGTQVLTGSMSDHLCGGGSVFWADYSLSSCGPQRPISVSWKWLF